MRYLSVCSGIEAATVAWHPLGWKPVAFSEIEKFPSRVLAHHYPDVPNLGDMTKYEEWDFGAIDLFVGGTPCQSFSVAGLRKGLDDPRGNLMLTFGAIANRFRPRWLVWENVPGVLSSNGGRDFGSFLGMLGKLGYGFAYRVLDAQYFGVAQRRRRVFVVGYFGDWRRAAAVLFERHSLQGHPVPSRKKGQETSKTTSSSIVGALDCGIMAQTYSMITANTGSNGLGVSVEIAPTLDCAQPAAVAQPVAAFKYTMGSKAHGIGYAEEQAPTLDTKPDSIAVTQPLAFGVNEKPEVAHCLRSNASKADKHESTTYAVQQMAVRRLTPVECERLQGFPDNYTNIPNAADGPRYKALGNSMAVPVMRWIGKRIKSGGV